MQVTQTTIYWKNNISITEEQIREFCQHWHIKEFYLFGSVLRSDFNLNSDIDIMITFNQNATCSLWDFVRIKNDLSTLLGRKIDLMTKKSIEESYNWIRCQEILNTAILIYGE
jgi:uncharacterized protein